MVTRRRKLFAAGVVLAIGFGLAWPLRRTEPLVPMLGQLASAPVVTQALTKAVDLDRQGSESTPLATGVDASNLPAASGRDPFADAPSPVISAAAPVYSTISAGPNNTAPLGRLTPAEQIHVVHQGDSLDRLAKRYLGDEARALEIFDLNREVLENPHLLPIGAELRLPSVGSSVDD